MKRLIPFVLVLVLAGCANIQNAYDTLTGTVVSPTAVYVARNSFDAVEVTATNYIVYCKVHPAQVGCSKSAIAQMIPAVRAGRVARNNLVAFEVAHPGALGPTGLYDALTAATNTLQAIQAQYHI